MVELRDYLRVIRKRWWLLPAAVALAVGVAGLATLRTPAQYASSTTFFIGTPNRGVTEAYQGSLLSQERVKSYANVLSGDRLAAAIAKQPGIGLSADEVQRQITTEPIQGTVLLRAVVTDGSKARSKLIAEALASQFPKMVESLETPTAVANPPAAGEGSPARTASDLTVRVEVVAGPRLDPNPVSPRPVRNLGLAALLGLLVGAGIAVVLEATDNSVQSSEALRELAGAPVLANIPYDSDAPKVPLVSGRTSRAARAEALRQLRTNLQFVDVDRPVRVIVVTSAVPDEGKSSTAVNLAIVFAEAGQRVLVVDADLRRPKLAEYLGIEGAAGLTNLLAGQAQSDDVIQRWGPRLWALPSGSLPPNPSELLASQHMADLLKAFRERFDIVVIDTPPLLAVTDGAVLAARGDGALLVARAGKTSSSQITAAVRALDAVNARLFGCAFNMVPGTKESGYYYHQDHRAVPDCGRSRTAAETTKAEPVGVPAAVGDAAAAPPPAPTVAAATKDPSSVTESSVTESRVTELPVTAEAPSPIPAR
jgi:capsular exopolysaccharide synthesis family protein